MQTPPTGAGEGRLSRIRAAGLGDLLFVPVVLGLIVLTLSVTTEGFLTSTNLTNIFLQASILAMVAFGMTYLILLGELDLSVGPGIAVVSVVTAMVMRDTGSIELGVVAGIATGAVIGAINGLLVTRLEVPAFIATLGMLVILEGVALQLTDAAIIGGLPEGIGALTRDTFLGVRWILWLVVAIFVFTYLLQSRTTFGIQVFAVGGNREVARLSGISVDRVRFLCFLLTGVLVGIAGVALTSRVGSGQPGAGGGFALIAIAAVVVGGTSLYGGRGSVARTLWGVLLITVVQNGLNLRGVGVDLQNVAIGVILIIAASADYFMRIPWRATLKERIGGIVRAIRRSQAGEAR